MNLVSQQRRYLTMIIKPLIRDNIALNAHPKGCYENIVNDIKWVETQDPITSKPLNVLIIGGSSGYGLASRIALAFGSQSYTYNVSFERAGSKRSTASAGHYNNLAFTQLAKEKGIASDDFNGDAFSFETKDKVLNDFIDQGKKIDLLIYSVASGIRIDPYTQEKYVSSLKPIGEHFEGLSVDVAKKTLKAVSLEPASEEEIESTRKVMGGEDYLLWVQAIADKNLFSNNAKTITYTYLGSELTYPIYKDGTIGNAKRDLEESHGKIQEIMNDYNGEALISSSKTVVTKASVFIPTVALYGATLFKVMKEKDTHESILEHKYRLYKDMVYGNKRLVDEQGLVRLDSFELDGQTQEEVKALMAETSKSEDLDAIDFDYFIEQFNQMNGFMVNDVDYEEDLDILEFNSNIL